jgi:hypothetical protein
MGRKKKISFKLNPEWMLKEPLDFEYNKYTLLGYIQKCEKGFDKLEIYPDFVEISLHLANLQSLIKENTLLLTNKKFESCDDEILVKELTPKKPRELTGEEEVELFKTLKYSNGKLFDTFNVAKSIWNLAYDNIEIFIKKNKKGIVAGNGYVYFYNKSIEKLFVWEYEIKKPRGDKNNHKTYLTLIYEGEFKKFSIPEIIDQNSNWKETDYYKQLPIFEAQSSQNFPMNETLVPIIKRKIMSYIFQIVNTQKINNFDFEE